MLWLLSIFIATIMLVVFIQYSYNSNINSLIESNQNLLAEFVTRTKIQQLLLDVTSVSEEAETIISQNKKENRNIVNNHIKRIQEELPGLKTLEVDDDRKQKLNEMERAVNGMLGYLNIALNSLSDNEKPLAIIAYKESETFEKKIIALSDSLTVSKDKRLSELILLTDKKAKEAKKWGLIMAILAILASIYTFLYINQKITLQAALIKRLNESEKKVREAARIKENFLANMSHEIRTPMNAILGFIHLLQKQDTGAASKEFINSIQSASENLLTIINDILDSSKIEAGMMRIEATPFSLRGLIDSVKTMFIIKAKEKGLSLTTQTDKNIPDLLSGDAIRLTQILINLIGNSIKFTSSGKIEIEVENDKQQGSTIYLSFTVKDTGIGIPKDKISSVFERFHQGDDNTTRKYGGTGLGLSIVKQLVHLQKGSVSVNSEDGKGSEFIFIIPYTIVQQTSLPVYETGQTDEEPLPVNKDILLLVVEDNVLNQNLMQHLLTDWGIQFRIAQNGAEALEEVKTRKFDLVLMDIQMPEMNGYTATGIIRNELHLTVPIVAMTAHAMAGEREKCLSFGMNEYVSKPVKEKELYKIIEALTRQQPKVNPKETIASSVLPHPVFNTIDTAYLKELSGGKKSFQKEMTVQFIAQLPGELQALDTAFAARDYKQCGQVAHSLKTSVSFMGLTEKLNEPLDYIENYIVQEEDSQTVTAHVICVKTICSKAMEEAKQFLADLNES